MDQHFLLPKVIEKSYSNVITKLSYQIKKQLTFIKYL